MIRVLIVDDHAIVRQGLRRILEEAKGMKVGGEAANGVEALKMMRTEKWDVVLLDISMPEKNGIDTLKQIMDRDKEAKVLILSMYPEDQYAVRLMKAGASGYLTKETAPEQLVEAIRRVVDGKKHISPNLAELLLQECGLDSGKAAARDSERPGISGIKADRLRKAGIRNRRGAVTERQNCQHLPRSHPRENEIEE